MSPASTTAATSFPPHHRVTSLSIEGGRHFTSLRIPFPDGLTCIIGARGTGKTGILWAICFALGAVLPEGYAEELDAHMHDTLGAGTVTVETRTEHGAKHTWSRKYGEAPVVRDESGMIVKVSVADGALFGVQAFSQGQIEEIATSEAEQLALIDGFVLAEVRRIDADVQALERKLDRCEAEQRRLEGDIAAESTIEGELATVLEALKGVAMGASEEPPRGAAPVAAGERSDRNAREQAHASKVERGRERVAMTSLGSEVGRVRDALDAFTRDALRRLAAVEGSLERGPHGEIFRAAHEAMVRLSGILEATGGKLRGDIETAARAVDAADRALLTAHAAKDEAYQALVLRDDDDRRRALHSASLQKRFEELSTAAKRLSDKRRQEAAARTEWRGLLAERARLLANKSALRKEVAKRLEAPLNGEVSADVVPRGSSASFAALLAEVIKGDGFQKKYLEAVARRIPPEDLASIVARGEIEPLVEVDPFQSERKERAARFIEAIRRSGRLREVERATLEDLPVLELLVKKKLRPSKQLSTGQRCALALLLLLQPAVVPLLVDQAEDSLDNEFIYGVLVRRIAAVKGGRQVLLVTHNPNPPALAHAEQILALDVDESGLGMVVANGKFEAVSRSVERLEGGRKAFLERGERYGHFIPARKPDEHDAQDERDEEAERDE